MGGVRDARGREFAGEKKRIVSLVPSWTESLFVLGAGERVVAATDYCVETPGAVSLRRIGGTKNPRVADILALRPDLVIANREENRKTDVDALEQGGTPVFVTDAHTVDQALGELKALSELVGCPNASRITGPIEEELALRQARAGERRPRVFVAIWRDPWMTVNGDTFIGDMIRVCGGENVFEGRERHFPLAADLGDDTTARAVGERDVRYPRVSVLEVVAKRPDVVLLPDEPYPFTDHDAAEWREALGPSARIERLDGKVLSWYGVRMAASMRKLDSLLHDDT